MHTFHFKIKLKHSVVKKQNTFSTLALNGDSSATLRDSEVLESVSPSRSF
jgi:hypothetical protein